MEQILPFISDVGFPALVTFYLLYRIESKLEVVIETIKNLPNQLQRP